MLLPSSLRVKQTSCSSRVDEGFPSMDCPPTCLPARNSLTTFRVKRVCDVKTLRAAPPIPPHPHRHLLSVRLSRLPSTIDPRSSNRVTKICHYDRTWPSMAARAATRNRNALCVLRGNWPNIVKTHQTGLRSRAWASARGVSYDDGMAAAAAALLSACASRPFHGRPDSALLQVLS